MVINSVKPQFLYYFQGCRRKKVAIPFKLYFERDVLMLQNCSQETLINNTNEEAAKVHKHFIKWLSKIIKKKGECHICQAPWRSYLEVYCDVRERRLLPWNQNKHIYYIFHILIPKSVLVFHVFHTIAATSFDDSNFIIARLQSVICQLPFWCLPDKFVDILSQSFWRHYGFTYFERSRFQMLPFPLPPSTLCC